MGPGTLGVAAAQINVFVNTVLAVTHEGAPTALSFAFRFMYLPVGIFGVSVATAAIPVLARYAAEGALDEMRRTISWGLRLMFVLSIPACVGLMVLTNPVVELIYMYKNFRADSASLVALALFYYSPGIIGYSIVKIASPSFYALRDARTPVIISVIAILTNLVLNLALNWKMGFIGLALGTAIAANVNALILLVLLSRRLNGLDSSRVVTTVVKTLVASAVMGVVSYYTERVLHGVFPDQRFLHRFIRVFGAIGAGVATLMVSAWILRIDELRQAVGRMIRRPTA
jgi:putative peptidoglycan lipid II flippase